MYDIGIIGGGPAALSAAVSARQRNKSVCIFGRSLDSSLLFAAEKVDNCSCLHWRWSQIRWIEVPSLSYTWTFRSAYESP